MCVITVGHSSKGVDQVGVTLVDHIFLDVLDVCVFGMLCCFYVGFVCF